MARYAAGHKRATRDRIVASAARRFKTDGVDGAGIAGLMADAGLTNGAFYAHFRSKDDLVAAAVAAELAAQRAVIEQLPATRAAVTRFVRDYLSVAHRDSPGDGCPSAALLADVGRAAPLVRSAYTAGIEAIVDTIADKLDPARPDLARPTAGGVVGLLVGTLQLARAVRDERDADRVLADARAQAAVLIKALPHAR